MSISTNPGVWLGAILQLCILSFLIKDTKLFRYATAIIVGGTTAYQFSKALNSLISMGVTPMLGGDILLIIPFAIGLLMYARYVKGYEYFGMWGPAILLGSGLGFALSTTVKAQIIDQILGIVTPLTSGGLDSINSLVSFISVVSVLTYFFFTVGKSDISRKVASTGRIVILVAFGSAFGAVVLMRINLLISVLKYILWDWLGFGF